jgi:hypothetical protein
MATKFKQACELGTTTEPPSHRDDAEIAEIAEILQYPSVLGVLGGLGVPTGYR